MTHLNNKQREYLIFRMTEDVSMDTMDLLLSRLDIVITDEQRSNLWCKMWNLDGLESRATKSWHKWCGQVEEE